MCFAFHPVQSDGWEQHGTMVFSIDSVKQAGEYALSVGVRTTYAYPYQSLWLQVIMKMDSLPQSAVDTMELRITDSQGNILGKGKSLFQLLQPLRLYHFVAGQSGSIEVRHIMRTATLPGVSDVGILLQRADAIPEAAD